MWHPMENMMETRINTIITSCTFLITGTSVLTGWELLVAFAAALSKSSMSVVVVALGEASVEPISSRQAMRVASIRDRHLLYLDVE